MEVSLSGVKEKVRFIGVDCPEAGTDEGTAATEYTRKAIDGRKVYLETDVGLRDKYGRLLAYVWLTEPKQVTEQAVRSQMFNARLLLAGMAQLMTVPPNVKYVDYSTAFQREAREAKVGLWADDRDIQEPAAGSGVTVYITASGTKYHREGCTYLSESKIPITLEEAKAKGYGPCSVCKPPT